MCPFFWYICFGENSLSDIYGQTLIGLIATIAGIYYIIKPRIIRFDDNYLYVCRGKEIKKVPLERIYKIKLTMSKIGLQRVWKIGYTDSHNQSETVRVILRLWNNNFQLFQEKVKEKNPSIRIQDWSHSFDFDQ